MPGRIAAKAKCFFFAILVIFVIAKIANGCRYDPGFADPNSENSFYTGIFFYASIFLNVAIVVTHFISRRRTILFIGAAIVSFVAMLPISLYGRWIQDCGEASRNFVGGYAVWLLILFILQLTFWITQVSRPKRSFLEDVERKKTS